MEPRDSSSYNADVDQVRPLEYPMLEEVTYLDHGGTTLYSKRLIDGFAREMTLNLFGNPHAESVSSQLSTARIEDTRLQVLRFLRADPAEFDVVFVANATAAIKLVMEAFREQGTGGFWYGYHRDSHSSVVGVRETARGGSRCFKSDQEVEAWIDGLTKNGIRRSRPHTKRAGLFAYPAQSNLNGRRLPLDWTGRLREASRVHNRRIYSLLDAAAFLTTGSLDLSDPSNAPDFTALSFYKIFGFPDLGALIVRKDSGHVLLQRRYFGGGTVAMVTSMEDPWHAKKTLTLHDQLEDGTLPFHSILALQVAFRVHQELYGSAEKVSGHTAHLALEIYNGLSCLRHGNGQRVCRIYRDQTSTYGDTRTQGPVIAFNLVDSKGDWVGKSDVEKLASAHNIHFRTGGMCNPGGVAHCLGLSAAEMRQNYEEGLRCGDENDVMRGKPTGMIRVSLGAMSNLRDVEIFLGFVRRFYVDESAKSEMTAATLVKGEKAAGIPAAYWHVDGSKESHDQKRSRWCFKPRPPSLAWVSRTLKARTDR